MAYIICQPCIGVKDASCVDVCPVECIVPGKPVEEWPWFYIDPDTWVAAAPHKDGSWWPEWVAWLERRSSGLVPPPRMAAPETGYAALADAPGLYILQE